MSAELPLIILINIFSGYVFALAYTCSEAGKSVLTRVLKKRLYVTSDKKDLCVSLRFFVHLNDANV